MTEIVRKPGFLPETTWLLCFQPPGRGQAESCGTVQGIRDAAGLGAIQNLGIVREHRNCGLGTALSLLRSGGSGRRASPGSTSK